MPCNVIVQHCNAGQSGVCPIIFPSGTYTATACVVALAELLFPDNIQSQLCYVRDQQQSKLFSDDTDDC